MRFSSSSGFSVGATHWPMFGSAARVVSDRPCSNRNAGAALPNIGQWVAPPLNPEELEKRIEELRTVQFWLEQNAKMLGATIQALEVQRMTLSTLKTMNVQMTDLRESLQLKVPPSPAAATDATVAADPPAAVDPMQWWGALTQQFTQLATAALKDGAGGATKAMADAFVPSSMATAAQPRKKLPPSAHRPQEGSATQAHRATALIRIDRNHADLPCTHTRRTPTGACPGAGGGATRRAG